MSNGSQGEEVRIVAVLDTTDIDNGVKRVDAAAKKMKQVWETTTWVGMPRPGGGGGDGGDGGGGRWAPGGGFSPQPQKQDPLASLVQRLLIRDAIYGVIRGFGEMIGTVNSDLRELSGAVKETGGFFKELGHIITGGLSMIPGVGGAFRSYQESISRSNVARDMQALQEEQFRQNPDSLKTPTSDLQRGLISLLEERQKIDQQFGAREASFAANGNTSGLHQAQQDHKEAIEHLKAQEQWQRKLIEIAESRDRRASAADARGGRADFHSLESVANADEFISAQISEENARKAREAARRAKRLEEQKLSDQERTDQAARTRARKDLSFTEGELRRARVTSAVSINGSLYGRSDSATALVQHAQRQISELRQINRQLSEIRKQRSDLTLL